MRLASVVMHNGGMRQSPPESLRPRWRLPAITRSPETAGSLWKPAAPRQGKQGREKQEWKLAMMGSADTRLPLQSVTDISVAMG